MANKFYDIAIIGAGVSGLYAAEKLSHSSVFQGKTIAVFEASERIGGRINSVHDVQLGVPAELGCMRYLKSQPLITNLIEVDYSLPIQPFDTGIVNNHIYYLRGKYLDSKNWNNVPYHLPEKFRGMSPFNILDNIIDDVKFHQYQRTNKIIKSDWNEIKKELYYPFEGSLYLKKLQDIGFANLISESSSYEVLKFLCDSGEYYAKTINWNASEAFPYSQSVGYKAKDNIEYWCISSGFSSICEKLSHSMKEQGVKLSHQMELRMISPCRGGEGKYELLFNNKKNNTKCTVTCNRIILAIPKQPLKKLIWTSELGGYFYGEQFSQLLNSVRSLPTIRFALVFKNTWWKEIFNGLNGHMVTDLPLRHGYYFGSKKLEKYSVFLSTIDAHMADYWAPYIGDSPSGILSEEVLIEIMKQLKLIHKTDKIENPIYGIFSNWSSDFFGGGFHSWNPGYNVSEVMNAMQKPFVSEDIHIIGEAFSQVQGWVEGALSTTENLLNLLMKDYL